MMRVKLMQGDCLELMQQLPDGLVDAVIADPPYGTTACKWDAVIPFEPIWEQLHRIVKPDAVIAMTASQPFTSALISSNINEFKYCWYYIKTLPTGHLNAKKQPMRAVEEVVVFCSGVGQYHPQKTQNHARRMVRNRYEHPGKGGQAYGKESRDTFYDSTERYPTNCIKVNNVNKGKMHPTQKPVALMEYLIKTYTNEGETVLDFTMGSGTTGVACVKTNRNFIGMELDEEYFKIATERIKSQKQQPSFGLQ